MNINIELFWRNVEKTATCWEYTKFFDKDGYGRIYSYGSHKTRKAYRAHRVSWTLHFGEIPVGLHVCHKCDNPSCVNPSHLFLGTDRDNALDKMSKGRQPINSMPGETNPSARMTWTIVEEIRNKHAAGTHSYNQLAKEYGVGKSSIARIIKKTHWRKSPA